MVLSTCMDQVEMERFAAKVIFFLSGFSSDCGEGNQSRQFWVVHCALLQHFSGGVASQNRYLDARPLSNYLSLSSNGYNIH